MTFTYINDTEFVNPEDFLKVCLKAVEDVALCALNHDGAQLSWGKNKTSSGAGVEWVCRQRDDDYRSFEITVQPLGTYATFLQKECGLTEEDWSKYL
jgi:hypothetical protein